MLNDEQRARLREGLARRGWGQTDLAKAITKRDGTISDLFSGEKATRQSTLDAVCNALEMSFHYLIMGTEPKWTNGAKSASSTELRAVPMSLGVDLWLADTPEGRSTTSLEREMMRAAPWHDPYVRYEDEAYRLVLLGFRRTLNARK